MRSTKRMPSAPTGQSQSGSAASWLPPLTLATLALTLYLSTRSQVHTFDALSYIRDVDQSAGFFFHPHHLLYNPSGWLFWQFWRRAGYTGNAEVPLQVLNSLAGILCGIGLYRLVLRLTQCWWAALAAAGLLVFNYTVWYFSVEVEVYLLALIWLLLTLALLITLLYHPRPGIAILLGVTVGMATLYHQANGLLVPIVVIAVVLSPLCRRTRLTALTMIGTIAGTIVALGYTLVGFGYYGFQSVAQLGGWMFFFIRTGWWGHPASDRLSDLGAGLGNSLSPQGPWPYWAAIVILVLLGGPGAFKRWPRVIVLCCAWIVIYGAFFVWWEADNIEFWIATLLPVWVLVGLCTAALGAMWRHHAYRWGLPATAVVACMLPLLLAWQNYPIVQRRGDPRTDLQRALVNRLQVASSHGDLILPPGGVLELYLPFYADRPYVRTLNGLLFETDGDLSTAFARLREDIDASLQAGLAVFVAREALVLPRERFPRYQVTQAQLDAFWRPYRTALEPAVMDHEGAIAFWRIPPATELARGGGWRWQDFAWGWQATHIYEEHFTQGGWCFTPQVDPTLMSPVLSLPAAQVRAIRVRMSTQTQHQHAQLFYTGLDGALREQYAVSWPLVGDGQPRTYTTVLAGAPAWQGTITRLRLDPIASGDDSPGSTTCVESLRMLP